MLFLGLFLQIPLHKYPQYVIPSFSHIPQTAIILPQNIFCYQGIPDACWLPVIEMVARFVLERDPKKSVMQMKIWQLSRYQCNYTAVLMWEEKLCLLV